MAIYYSQGDGNWSTTTNWDTNTGGGGSDPASGDAAGMDGHTFVIQANHAITLDLDMTAWTTGLAGLTITSHATTPGMLRAKYDTDAAYGLKVKTGTTIVGTNAATKGRLLANSDGVWGNTGVLPFARKFIVQLDGTAYIDATYLDIALRGTEPGITSIATYLAKQTVTGSAAADTLTKTSHGYANTTPLMFQVSGGSLPAPLTTTGVYYVVSTAANTFQVAYVSGGAAIDLTTDGSGTIEAYTGHASTSTATMNVLTNVTGDAQWVSGAAVVLVDVNDSAAYDQQRVTINGAPNAGDITLSANVDSAQYPGARIVLMTRNVAIRSNTTAGTNLVSYPSGATHGGVFGCEIRSTAGTGTTFYATGVSSGMGHTMSGTISGCSLGVSSGTGHTVSGTISGCSTGVYSGTGHTVSGTISGCSSVGRFDPIQALQVIIRGTATVTTPPTFSGRNTNPQNGYGEQGLYYEDDGGTLGASYAYLINGDNIKNTVTVRAGGAASSIEVVPQSLCSTIALHPILSWTEYNVAASAQTRSVYMRGGGPTGWVTFPTALQLWFEAEYLSHASLMTRTIVKSTDVIADNTTWVKFDVTFTPAQAGLVRYRAYLGAWAAAAAIYVDNMLTVG